MNDGTIKLPRPEPPTWEHPYGPNIREVDPRDAEIAKLQGEVLRCLIKLTEILRKYEVT